MPQKLSEPPEELIRQFYVDNARVNEMQGYNPQQTDQTQSDFLPVTNDWSDNGDYYPIVVVEDAEGSVIGAGDTAYTGIQGDGSGPNQDIAEAVTVSVQAVDDETYLNGVSAREIIQDIYAELHHQIQNNVTTAIPELMYADMGPSTHTKNQSETDSGSTVTWHQEQGTATLAWRNEP